MLSFSVYFYLQTKSIPFLVFCLFLSKISNAFKLAECDVMPHCMNENNLALVSDLTNISCHKTAKCQLLAINLAESSCQKQFHVALEKFEVKNSWIQMHLVTSLPSELKGTFLFKISFGNATCYNFAVDSSFLFSAKESFVLPCIHFRRHQQFHLFAYYKEETSFELINFQAVEYNLTDTSELQVFESGFLNIAPSSYARYFYLTSNTKEDGSCSFSYKVSIYEVLENQACDIQKPVCNFSSVLRSPDHYLPCSWNHLKPCQKYCILTFFSGHTKCKYAYPEKNIQITFFKVVPTCEGWNASIAATSQDQEVKVRFNTLGRFEKCFNSYQILLYRQKWAECDINRGRPKSNITINQTYKQADITIKDIKIGNYCVVVIPCQSGICYTNWARHQAEKVFVKGKTQVVATIDPILPPKQEFPIYIAISLLLLITGIGIWRIAKKQKELKFQDYAEQRPLEQVVTPLISTVTYIFHSSDGRDLRIVDALVEYLCSCAGLQVYTLKDVFHEILPKPHRWLRCNILCECRGNGSPCSSNKRFLFLVTDRSKQLVSNSSDTLQMTNVESIFHDFIDYMLRYPNIFSRNHSHVFKVSFEARFIRELNGVAGTSWELLTDRAAVVDLCLALGSQESSDTLEAALETHSIREFLWRER